MFLVPDTPIRSPKRVDMRFLVLKAELFDAVDAALRPAHLALQFRFGEQTLFEGDRELLFLPHRLLNPKP